MNISTEEENLDILYICNSLDLGGAEKILKEIVLNLKNYNKEIICLTGRGFHSNYLENKGIKIFYCNMNKNIFNFLNLIRIYKIILNKKPKIIHSFLFHSDVIASILGKLALTKFIIWSVHHDFKKFDNKFLRNIQVKFLSIISHIIPIKIIFCSKRSLVNHEKFGFSKRKSILIKNGICTQKFKPRKNIYFKFRKLLGIKKNTFLIGHIARFHPIKGHIILLKSLSLLKKQNRDFKCIMIGKNINKKNLSLKKKIKELDLGDNIILYGETKFPQKIINSFDLNIISSLSESSPLVLLETMSSGIPSLSTNVGSVKETIGETGWVVKRKSPKALAEKLFYIIKNRSNLNKKSIEARERIIRNYSQKKMLKQYNKTYKFLLKSS